MAGHCLEECYKEAEFKYPVISDSRIYMQLLSILLKKVLFLSFPRLFTI